MCTAFQSPAVLAHKQAISRSTTTNVACCCVPHRVCTTVVPCTILYIVRWCMCTYESQTLRPLVRADDTKSRADQKINQDKLAYIFIITRPCTALLGQKSPRRLNSIFTCTSDSCICKPARYKHMVRHTKGTYIVAKYGYFMAAYPAVVLAVARTHEAASSAPSNLGRACSNAHKPSIARTHPNYSRLTRRIEGAGCPLHARTHVSGRLWHGLL